VNPVTLARNAMATRFEIVLHGGDPAALRAAGEEALDEIDQLEAQLSLYRPGSEIAQLNAHAAREAVRVTPEVFALLEHARRLHAESGGAFDITLAPLVRCWGFMGTAHQGRVPSDEELEQARSVIGMNLVQLDAQHRTVRFAREGVMLDLGAIGKGYALERAAELLRESGITSALLHGGTSTVYTLGSPPDAAYWKVAINQPPRMPSGQAPPHPTLSPRGGEGVATVPLKNESLSVSAVWGRSFEVDGKQFGHVLDPRTGRPVSGALMAAVVLPSATETDALSTALLVRGKEGLEPLATTRPGLKALIAFPDGEGFGYQTRGLTLGTAQNAR